MTAPWFDVDRVGLAKLLADRPSAFVLYELVSNAWDTQAKVIEVTIEPVPNKPLALVIVGDDDPEGFADLSHAFTLFAESRRKGMPEKRGRFNLGEKLVLARCAWAEIVTTTGGVRFDDEGRRPLRRTTLTGSVFRAEMRMTREELTSAIADFRKVIPPEHRVTRLNGEEIARPDPISSFVATLPTVRADEEGNLRRSERMTSVTLYQLRPGEFPTLYEMGIPVVELDGAETFHIDVAQKVPLNSDRDNVTPSFLRALRVAILNNARGDVVATPEAATTPWVREAAGDSDCSRESIADVLRLRFGEKRVAYDPSDVEAVGNAISAGATVVYGGALSAGEWENARRANAILPAGKVYPSHMSAETSDDYRVIAEDEWTEPMLVYAERSMQIVHALLDVSLRVRFIDGPNLSTLASWLRGIGPVTGPFLTVNIAHVPESWMTQKGAEFRRGMELLVHEMAHHRGGGNHLAEEYHRELCRLAVLLADHVKVRGW
jgi:hypothetical protein